MEDLSEIDKMTLEIEQLEDLAGWRRRGAILTANIDELHRQLAEAQAALTMSRTQNIALSHTALRAEQAEAALADLQQYTAACEATSAEWRERYVKAEATLVKLVGQYDAFCLRAVQAEQRAEQAEAALRVCNDELATREMCDQDELNAARAALAAEQKEAQSWRRHAIDMQNAAERYDTQRQAAEAALAKCERLRDEAIGAFDSAATERDKAEAALAAVQL